MNEGRESHGKLREGIRGDAISVGMEMTDLFIICLICK